ALSSLEMSRVVVVLVRLVLAPLALRLSPFLTHFLFFFFFNDTATTEIYTLSLHDALPISQRRRGVSHWAESVVCSSGKTFGVARSEEHTSELQSRVDLVCRLLLEKKKNQHTVNLTSPPRDKQPYNKQKR